jgi:hypothetical protein
MPEMTKPPGEDHRGGFVEADLTDRLGPDCGMRTLPGTRPDRLRLPYHSVASGK